MKVGGSTALGSLLQVRVGDCKQLTSPLEQAPQPSWNVCHTDRALTRPAESGADQDLQQPATNLLAFPEHCGPMLRAPRLTTIGDLLC